MIVNSLTVLVSWMIGGITHLLYSGLFLWLLLGISNDRLPLMTPSASRGEKSFAPTEWRVIDTHPVGVPCRWNSELSMEEVRDSLKFEEWAIERHLTWGQRFRSQPHEGEAFFYDDQGSPWLFVPFSTLTGKSQGCFVPFKNTSIRAIPE
jgi:hypothetical protein